MRKLVVVVVPLLLLGACGEGSGPGTGGGSGGGSFGGGTGSGGGGGSSVTCNASNCLGCCFNGACQGGNTAAACGKNGAACLACSTGNICDSSQACVLDPQGRWRIVPVSGTFSTGGNWDVGGGAPDGKVYLTCPATAATISLSTLEASDNFNPNYTVSSGSCVMTTADLRNIGFAVEVVEVDVTSDDVAMSTSTIKLNDSHFTSGSINLATMDNSCTVRLTVTRQ